MRKRIITKIGDVFCINIDQNYKVYFQYIGDDAMQLNSSVIRVFMMHYKVDSTPTLEDILHDKIAFYAHTILKVGISQGLWVKVGNSKELGNPEKIGFKMLYESKDAKWYVWKINKPIKFLKELPLDCKDYEWGWVYAAMNIVNRIKNGYFYVLEEERSFDSQEGTENHRVSSSDHF